MEANQLIEQLEWIIIDCEKKNDITLPDIDRIFRIIHTIKGSSAMMAYHEISNLSHGLEDLFHVIREQKKTPKEWKGVFALVLAYIDYIKIEAGKIEQGKLPDGDASYVMKKCKAIVKQLENSIPAEGAEEEKKYFCFHVLFDQNAQMENIRSHLLLHSMEKIIKKLILTVPQDLALEENADFIKNTGLYACILTAADKSELQKHITDAQAIHSYEIIEVKEPPQDIKELFQHTEIETIISKIRSQNYISVHHEKLNVLMDLVGELVTAHAMVINNTDLAGMKLPNFRKSARQLEKLINELRDTVVEIRTLPVSVIFHKMHRIVRDMSSQLNKEVDFSMTGQDTQVDKSVVDMIAEPIMHLIRNAVDHGIETARQRKKNNKPPNGRVALNAWQNSSYVFVEVADDGKGLDKEQIYRKISQMGLTDKAAEEFSEQELFAYLFIPGYSTNENITEFSGRGVGMDIVKKSIDAVGGDLSITSEKGKGTSVIIRIPLTLLIIDVMQVRVGEHGFALPLRNIKEAKKVKEKDIVKDQKGNEVIVIRDTMIPVIRLHRFFQIQTSVQNLEEGILLFVEGQHNTACLFVDKIEDEQQIVVKPLPQYIKNTKGLSGCSIQNDGSLSLILDITEILSFKENQ